jgi:hypothetical protein
MQLFKLIFFIRLMRENNVTIYVHRIGKFDTFHFPLTLCSHFQDGCLLGNGW